MLDIYPEMARAFFLVLIMNATDKPAMTTIPKPFISQVACEAAGTKWLKDTRYYNDFYCLYHETPKDSK